MCVYLFLYQALYDLTNPTVCNLKSVLALTNALGRNLISVLALTNLLGRHFISVLGLTNPLGRRLISALVLKKPSQVPHNTLDSTLLGHAFFNSPRLFLFSICIYTYIHTYMYAHIILYLCAYSIKSQSNTKLSFKP